MRLPPQNGIPILATYILHDMLYYSLSPHPHQHRGGGNTGKPTRQRYDEGYMGESTLQRSAFVHAPYVRVRGSWEIEMAGAPTNFT